MTPEKFWTVAQRAGDDDCWEWSQHRARRGYGRLKVAGRTWVAHRYAWLMAHGEEAPPEMFVCHRCDNPPCCNPSHLFLGTCADNHHDMIAKGRKRVQVGTARHNARLDPDKVRAIRVAYADGATLAQLARQCGVTDNTIRYVIQGDTWKHVA